jgi:5,10-methylenetetrahydromethanopterin reductase
MQENAKAAVLDDLSAYVIAGAVAARQIDTGYETDSRTPAQGIEDAIDAEEIGFGRVFLSERWDIKEAGVILSGIAARTTRIEVGTGLVCPPTRHPWQMAAFSATMQCCYGERFILGLGRGDNGIFRDMGLQMATYRELRDYVDIVRALWRAAGAQPRGDPAGGGADPRGVRADRPRSRLRARQPGGDHRPGARSD